MKKLFLDHQIESLVFQRNLLVSVVAVLGVTTIVLSFFTFTKRERLIVVPNVVDKPFWLEASLVSPSYLEQQGAFLSQLLLSKTAQSASSQRGILLRHTSPEFYGVLKSKLLEEEETLKHENASYVFFPSDIQVDSQNLSVNLTGNKTVFVAGRQLSTKKETYLLKFRFSGSQLLLNGLSYHEVK